MNITIFGTGNMASGLAVLFAKTGQYQITLASRDVSKAQSVATELGNDIQAGPIDSAASNADVVVFAVPFSAAEDVVKAAGGLAGKVVVDITNPMTDDFSALTVGHTTSAAEEIQKLAPEAKVVKAFNTIFASVLHNDGMVTGQPATVFVAGDDEDARGQVAALAESTGFNALETGALASARYLEPVAGLNIALAYGLGHGVDIAPTWQRAA